MSENTNIEWATHSWNPWVGCTKVSPGCAHCYAEHSTPTRVARTHGVELWGKGMPRQRTSLVYWKLPAKWNRDACWFTNVVGVGGERQRVFPSLCDWLDDEVPIEWLMDFLKVIHETPRLDWLLLTKRPENFKERVHEAWKALYQAGHMDAALMLDQWLGITGCIQTPPDNVWFGVSVEDQSRAYERIPELLEIPAALRFLSVEPLLEPVRLTTVCGLSLNRKADHKPARPDGRGIDWVIVGGESGPEARPCNVAWVRDIVGQCEGAGVPCFVKQLGSNPEETRKAPFPGDLDYRLALKHPKGGDPAEWPPDLRVRRFPTPGENLKPAA